MIATGYSEEKVWEVCEIDIRSFETSIRKHSFALERIDNMLSEFPRSPEYEKSLERMKRVIIQRIADYKSCKDKVRDLQNIYCKSVPPMQLPDNSEETEKNKLEKEIRRWVENNIPNSPNKDDYVKAFKITYSLDDHKTMKQVDIVEEVFSYFTPNFTRQSLRKKVKSFVNSFSLDN
jgi:hypothetical protein